MANRVFMGKYETIRPLGEGGMGKVYLAKQRDSGRQVVVKVMHAQIASQPKFRECFQQEMQVMARFKHPHIVELFDASVTDGPCIVMEYLDGLPLDEVLQKQGQLSLARVGRLLGQLCAALQAAHARGIIHRDLKPGNIMLVQPGTAHEKVKVMDFGLSKIGDTVHFDLDKLKGADYTVAKGTPEYMCPEQIRGDEMDYRGDLYSVGVILFELLTGQLPFSGKTTMDILMAHVEQPPPRFSDVSAAGGVPSGIEMVVQHCLSKFPVERPQSARELAKRFGDALGEPILVEDDVSMQTMKAPAGAAPSTPSAPPPAAKTDPLSAVYHLEAYMPERIALVKLRGFVGDAGGEIVDSQPGVVRVRLGGPKSAYQLPSLGFMASMFGKNVGLINMELLMEKKDPSQSQLSITMVIRPAAEGKLADKTVQNPAWKDCCDRIFKDLRSYLMGKG